jgi:hypothetical protein
LFFCLVYYIWLMAADGVCGGYFVLVRV